MRFYFVLLIALFTGRSFAQSGEYKPLEYSEVVIVDSALTKSELYTKARAWFVDALKNSKEFVQYADKDEGDIIGNGYTSIDCQGFFCNTYGVQFKVRVQTKNGRAKITIYDFNNTVTYTGSQQVRNDGFGIVYSEPNEENTYILGGPKIQKTVIEHCNETIKMMIASFKVAMLKPASKDDNW